MSTTPIAPSPGDAGYLAGINDQFTRAFAAFNQPRIDNFNQEVIDWQRNNAVMVSEAKTNPNVVPPPFPAPPMLKGIDLGIADQIFTAYAASLTAGVSATLDISAAVTTYQMKYTPPAVAPPPGRPANPIGPEEGVGSGIFSDVDGDDRAGEALFYEFGIPYRLKVRLGWGNIMVRRWLPDFTAPQPPTPTFTGDAPAA
jgi:hypothetical protein